jgi:hypothetical protein
MNFSRLKLFRLLLRSCPHIFIAKPSMGAYLDHLPSGLGKSCSQREPQAHGSVQRMRRGGILRSGGYRRGIARRGAVSCRQDGQLFHVLQPNSGALLPAERMKIHLLPFPCQYFRGAWQKGPASFGSNLGWIARLSSSRFAAWPSRCTERPRSNSGPSNYPSRRRMPRSVPPSLGVRRRQRSACATKSGNEVGRPSPS